MKISLVCNLLFPGDTYKAVAYPIQTAMNVYWAISNQGHSVQLINASDSVEKMIFKLKVFKPDLIYNLAEGLTNSPVRVAFYPELYEKLGIPYLGGSGFLLTTSLNKYLSKSIVSDIGVKIPKSNLYFIDNETKKQLKIGNWEITFPAIIKPNYTGDSEGITQESIVKDPQDLEKVLNKRLKIFPKGVLVEEYIKGKEIGVCYLKGYGEKDVLFPMELNIKPILKKSFNIIDYNMKNYATKLTTIQQLSIRFSDDLPKTLIKRIQNFSRKIFDTFQVKDFCRIDFRVTSPGEVYFLELTPDITMLDDTHMFYAAKKIHNLSYGEVFGHIIKNAAKRLDIHYYKNNTHFISNILYKCVRKYHAFRFGNLIFKET